MRPHRLIAGTIVGLFLAAAAVVGVPAAANASDSSGLVFGIGVDLSVVGTADAGSGGSLGVAAGAHSVAVTLQNTTGDPFTITSTHVDGAPGLSDCSSLDSLTIAAGATETCSGTVTLTLGVDDVIHVTIGGDFASAPGTPIVAEATFTLTGSRGGLNVYGDLNVGGTQTSLSPSTPVHMPTGTSPKLEGFVGGSVNVAMNDAVFTAAPIPACLTAAPVDLDPFRDPTTCFGTIAPATSDGQSFTLAASATSSVDASTVTVSQSFGYVGDGSCAVDPTVGIGGTQNVSCSGFAPGISVDLVQHSAPTVVGSATVPGSGAFTTSFRVTDPGTHTLSVMLGGLTLYTSPSYTVGTVLAATGVDVAPWVILAAMLLLAGVIAVLARNLRPIRR